MSWIDDAKKQAEMNKINLELEQKAREEKYNLEKQQYVEGIFQKFRDVIPESLTEIENIVNQAINEGLIVTVMAGRSGGDKFFNYGLWESGNFEQWRHRGTHIGSDLSENDYDYTSCLVIQWSFSLKLTSGYISSPLKITLGIIDSKRPSITPEHFQQLIMEYLVRYADSL